MKIKCPACSQVLNIPDTAAGKVVKCPCGKQLRAPAPKPGASAPPTPGARPANPRPAGAGQPGKRPAGAPAGSPSLGGFDPDMFDELTDQDLKPVTAVVTPGRATAASSSSGGKLLQQYAGTRDAQSEMLIGSKIEGEIAGVGRRISGSLLDGVFYTIFAVIGVVISIAFMASGGEEGPDVDAMNNGTYVIIAAVLIPAIINAVLVSMSGQTLGKKLVGTRMINQTTGAPVGFTQGILFRNVGFGFFTGLPIIGIFVAIADIVYLFSENHETLHDKFAKTYVVLA